MKKSDEFGSAVKRRIYLDMNASTADKATARAAKLRLDRKRYIELLIEKDCKRK